MGKRTDVITGRELWTVSCKGGLLDIVKVENMKTIIELITDEIKMYSLNVDMMRHMRSYSF